MTLIWSQQGQNKLRHHQTVCCTFPLSATKNLFEGLIAVRDCIPPTLRVTHQCESELLFIDLLFSHKRRITLGVFYRPPGGDTKPLEDLRICIQELNSTAELILLGDFNLPDIDWSCNRALHQSDIYVHLIDIIQDNFLTQLVREPTRNQNILDLVISTSPDIVDRLLVGDCFSDHRSLSFRILCSPYVQRKSRSFSIRTARLTGHI